MVVIVALGFHATGPVHHHDRVSPYADTASPSHVSALEFLTEASLARDAAIVSFHRDPSAFPETEEMRGKWLRHLSLTLGCARSSLSSAITYAWSLVLPEDPRAEVLGNGCVKNEK